MGEAACEGKAEILEDPGEEKTLRGQLSAVIVYLLIFKLVYENSLHNCLT